MFERGPMMMRLISPRRTAPYQTLDSSSRITSPSTVAPGTTHALEWMVGPLVKRVTMPSCPVDSESGSIFIRDEREHGTFSPSSQDYSRCRVTQSRCLSLAHYNIVIKGLHQRDESVFIARMPSKITLALGT